ncbi:hypothetical protein GCM10017556_35790 [Micromonospora sagamiensis]|nr:hypothetical protein GCM10017556_35790 [Micromonospora sagamiensis]
MALASSQRPTIRSTPNASANRSYRAENRVRGASGGTRRNLVLPPPMPTPFVADPRIAGTGKHIHISMYLMATATLVNVSDRHAAGPDTLPGSRPVATPGSGTATLTGARC